MSVNSSVSGRIADDESASSSTSEIPLASAELAAVWDTLPNAIQIAIQAIIKPYTSTAPATDAGDGA